MSESKHVGSWFRAAVATLALALVLFLIRAPFLGAAREGRLVNWDEHFLYMASLGKALGTPGELLEFPGGPLRQFTQGYLAARAVVDVGGKPTPESVAATLAREVESPWTGIYFNRIFVSALSALGVAALAGVVQRQTRSWAIAIAFAALVSLAPIFMLRSFAAMGDGASWGLFCLACATVASRRLNPYFAAIVAGLLYGAAISSKIPTMLSMPFLVGLFLQQHWGRIRWSPVCFALALPIGLLIGLPEAGAFPIVMLKGIVGNMAIRGGDAGAANVARAMSAGVPVWMLLLFPIAAVVLLLKRRAWIGLGASAAVGVFVLATLRTPFLEPHYYASLVPVVGLTIAVAVGRLINRDPDRARAESGSPVGVSPSAMDVRDDGPARRCMPTWALAFIGVVVVGLGTWQVLDFRNVLSKHYARYAALYPAAEFVRSQPAGTRVAVTNIVDQLVLPVTDGASIRRTLARQEQSLIENRYQAFTSGAGLSTKVASTLKYHLVQPELLGMATGSALSAYAGDRPGLNVWTVIDNPLLAVRSGGLSRDDAIDMYRRGELDVLVIHGAVDEFAVQQRDRFASGLYADGREVFVYSRSAGSASTQPASTQPAGN